MIWLDIECPSDISLLSKSKQIIRTLFSGTSAISIFKSSLTLKRYISFSLYNYSHFLKEISKLYSVPLFLYVIFAAWINIGFHSLLNINSTRGTLIYHFFHSATNHNLFLHIQNLQSPVVYSVVEGDTKKIYMH